VVFFRCKKASTFVCKSRPRPSQCPSGLTTRRGVSHPVPPTPSSLCFNLGCVLPRRGPSTLFFGSATLVSAGPTQARTQSQPIAIPVVGGRPATAVRLSIPHRCPHGDPRVGAGRAVSALQRPRSVQEQAQRRITGSPGNRGHRWNARTIKPCSRSGGGDDGTRCLATRQSSKAAAGEPGRCPRAKGVVTCEALAGVNRVHQRIPGIWRREQRVLGLVKISAASGGRPAPTDAITAGFAWGNQGGNAATSAVRPSLVCLRFRRPLPMPGRE